MYTQILELPMIVPEIGLFGWVAAKPLQPSGAFHEGLGLGCGVG